MIESTQRISAVTPFSRRFEQGEKPLVSRALELLLRNESQRGGIDAISQPRRCGPVLENVTQVGVRVSAADLGARE